MRLTWVQPEDLLPHQLVQARSEGIDVTDVQARWLAAGGTTDAPVSGASDEPAAPALRALARELLEVLDARSGDWREPTVPDLPSLGMPADLETRTLNAWLGRCAGNLLGKPVEKIPRAGIREILESSGQWPLTQYITAAGVPDDIQRRWPWNRRSKPTSLREVIDGMPEDDDINFAILALLMMERFGPGEHGLTTEDVAQSWLGDLPAGRVFT
ncbi:MAG TPA: ADP-ribosylglycohydrolase family protein, partial [Kribbella sp.]